MRKKELELIAGLAEGTLDDETEARALIESSQQHRFEYEAQRAAIEALGSVEPARLTDHERAALHRDVWTELQATPASTARAPWFYRWAYVAAGFLVVTIGLGTILGQDGDDAGTEAFNEVASGLGDGRAAATATTESAAAADLAEAPTDEQAAEDGVAEAGPELGFFLERAQSVRDGDFSNFSVTDTASSEGTAADHAACLESLDLDGYEVVALISVEEAVEFSLEPGGPYLVAVPSIMEIGDRLPVAFVESETCRLAHLDE